MGAWPQMLNVPHIPVVGGHVPFVRINIYIGVGL